MTNIIKNVIKSASLKMEFEIRRITIVDEQSLYNEVRPIATYSPWNLNREFNTTYRTIKEFTKVDKYRCYELWKLA